MSISFYELWCHFYASLHLLNIMKPLLQILEARHAIQYEYNNVVVRIRNSSSGPMNTWATVVVGVWGKLWNLQEVNPGRRKYVIRFFVCLIVLLYNLTWLLVLCLSLCLCLSVSISHGFLILSPCHVFLTTMDSSSGTIHSHGPLFLKLLLVMVFYNNNRKVPNTGECGASHSWESL